MRRVQLAAAAVGAGILIVTLFAGHALAAQIRNTPTAELKTVKEYAAMMPFPPSVERFSAGVLHELLHGPRGNG